MATQLQQPDLQSIAEQMISKAKRNLDDHSGQTVLLPKSVLDELGREDRACLNSEIHLTEVSLGAVCSTKALYKAAGQPVPLGIS